MDKEIGTIVCVVVMSAVKTNELAGVFNEVY